MFKKNQDVTVIRHWSEKDGSSYISEATVHACGKKRMVLNTRDGSQCVGREFRPTQEQDGHGLCIPAVSKEEAERLALEHSAAWIAREIKRLEKLIVHYASDTRHVARLQEKLTKVRALTPCFVWRDFWLV